MTEKGPFYTYPPVPARLTTVNESVRKYNAAIDASLAEYSDAVEDYMCDGEIEETLELTVADTEPPLVISVNRSTKTATGHKQRFAMIYEGNSETPAATYITDSLGVGVARQLAGERVRQIFIEKEGQELDNVPLTGVPADRLWVGKFEVKALAKAIKKGQP